MTRPKVDSLQLSQRSNGLAFSHHHFLSASAVSASSSSPNRRGGVTTILSNIDGATLNRSRERKIISLDVVRQNKKSDTAIQRQPVKSLIPPAPLPARRVSKIERRRQSISAASIKSITSSILSRKRKFSSSSTLVDMPPEILDLIFRNLAQTDFHALLLSNSSLTEMAASHLYERPYFASTYRYAQFTHTVSHKEHYGRMVRTLDLSYFVGDEEEEELKPQAGWREWKMRNSVMYQVSRDRRSKTADAPSGKASGRSGSTHPSPHPFLERWSMNRDVSVGGVCHALAACQNLRVVDLSRLQVSEDFIVKHRDYPATTWTGLIYASDVPKAWTWESRQLVPIYANDIGEQLRRLPFLDTIKARGSLWLTTSMVSELVSSCPRLAEVDFRASGMGKNMRWAIKGTKDDVCLVLDVGR